jgi:hypothetical protein
LLVAPHAHRHVSRLVDCSCVKTLKSLGFTGIKGNGNKIPI